MAFQNSLTQLFNIELPMVQAGMVWASGWRLASAVSNAGALGLIGGGSMNPALLEEHIVKCKQATSKPFGVNLPLLYAGAQEQIEVIIRHRVPVVFSSAGNPALHTPALKAAGITVVHVVSSSKFAVKAAAAGCDALVAEGFEAGGHNGKEETTTLVLIPAVVRAVNIPVIAAGGIATGRQMLGAMVLGAAGVQIGSRFVASEEASSHPAFKQSVLAAKEGDTLLSLKSLTPVRLLRNAFFEAVHSAEQQGASREELSALLGKGRSRLGMFEGDIAEGELEIGQVSALIDTVLPAASIVREVWMEFEAALRNPLG